MPTGPAYRIRTSRTIIRCWDPADAKLLKVAIDENLDHLKSWLPWAQDEPEDLNRKIERLREYRGQFDLGQDYVYGIFDLKEAAVLGGTGLHTRLGPGAREIGYWIHKDRIRQGLATECTSALVKVAFEIDRVNRVEIHCDPRNVASGAVPQKLGFTREALLHKRFEIQGSWRDKVIWSLFAEEYPGSPSSHAEIEAYDVFQRRIL